MRGSRKSMRNARGAVREVPGADRIAEEAAKAFLAEHGAGAGAPMVVVIPALNEEATVARVIRSVPPEICGMKTETILVDDGSTDATADEAAKAGALVCRIPVNLGQGRAFRLGYRLARERQARVIGTADADGQFDPAELPPLVEPIVNGEADFVNGSRRLGRTETTDPVRRAGVVFFAGILSALTGTRITDPANGLRAFRAEITEAVPLRQTQYQTSEFLIGAILRGYRVVERPATMYKRTDGVSKKGGNVFYGFRFARVVVTTWWVTKRSSGSTLSSGVAMSTDRAGRAADGAEDLREGDGPRSGTNTTFS